MPPPPAAKNSASVAAPDGLIGGRFSADLTRPLPGAGGGLTTYAAIDRRDPRASMMAVQVRAGAPARAIVLAQLADLVDPRVLAPLAHGPAVALDRKPAWFVICPAPPGPALWAAGAPAPRIWSDGDLIERLLRPAAAGLAALAERRATHRAIRPDNIFLDPRRGSSATLGCGWASPPALLQPALFEPPYVAMCPGFARGEGSVADDVYALGVVMLVLATGRLPLHGLDETAIIRRKLEHGCYQAMAGDLRLSPAVGDLIKVMLSHEPQHRPAPDLLAEDPAAARGRQVAARVPRRAPRALEVGDQIAWDARSLALAFARQPDHAVKLLKLGVVDNWVRRVLADSTLSTRMEGVQTRRAAEGTGEDPIADARMVMRAIMMLDPLAPFCWRGLVAWPDGFGPVLAAAVAPAADGAPPTDKAATPPGTGLAALIEEAVTCEAISDWASARGNENEAPSLRQNARAIRATLRRRGWAGGMPRLLYSLNPMQPCRSPLLNGTLVARLSDLPMALEVAAGKTELRAQVPIDREIAAFIAAHQDQRLEGDILALDDEGPVGTLAARQLALLARLQSTHEVGPLPGLASWLAAQGAPLLDLWRSRRRRQARQASLTATVPSGDLAALLKVLEDPEELAHDEQEFLAAQAAIQRIDARLARLAGAGDYRAEASRRLGQEIAAALGLAALAGTAVAAALR